MTLTKKQQDLEKGCGKPVLNLNGDVTICCGDSMDDKIDESGKEWFLKYICPECKAELQGITFAKEETVIRMISGKIKKWGNSYGILIPKKEMERLEGSQPEVAWQELKEKLK